MWLMHKKKAMHKSKSVKRGEPVDTGVKGVNWSQNADIKCKKLLLHPHKFSSVSNPNQIFCSTYYFELSLSHFLYPKCREENKTVSYRHTLWRLQQQKHKMMTGCSRWQERQPWVSLISLCIMCISVLLSGDNVMAPTHFAFLPGISPPSQPFKW